MITIVDYGVGNLRSVENAFEAIGQSTKITDQPSDLNEASAIVLPGVGAFEEGMNTLRELNFVEPLTEQVIDREKPFLGICAGLQFLAKKGFEHGEHEGFGWIDGSVRKIEPSEDKFRVPHIGWNELDLKQSSPLFEGLEENPVFYFVHSYHFVSNGNDRDVVTSTCWHGTSITASVQKKNIHAVQFHPEKSQKNGLTVLENFVELL